LICCVDLWIATTQKGAKSSVSFLFQRLSTTAATQRQTHIQTARLALGSKNKHTRSSKMATGMRPLSVFREFDENADLSVAPAASQQRRMAAKQFGATETAPAQSRKFGSVVNANVLASSSGAAVKLGQKPLSSGPAPCLKQTAKTTSAKTRTSNRDSIEFVFVPPRSDVVLDDLDDVSGLDISKMFGARGHKENQANDVAPLNLDTFDLGPVEVEEVPLKLDLDLNLDLDLDVDLDVDANSPSPSSSPKSSPTLSDFVDF